MNREQERLAGYIDGRCGCVLCRERTEDTYRMVGHCRNCGGGPFLILYRAGDKAAVQDCPTCGGYSDVYPERLATEDEIPAAALPGTGIRTTE